MLTKASFTQVYLSVACGTLWAYLSDGRDVRQLSVESDTISMEVSVLIQDGIAAVTPEATRELVPALHAWSCSW